MVAVHMITACSPLFSTTLALLSNSSARNEGNSKVWLFVCHLGWVDYDFGHSTQHLPGSAKPESTEQWGTIVGHPLQSTNPDTQASAPPCIVTKHAQIKVSFGRGQSCICK